VVYFYLGKVVLVKAKQVISYYQVTGVGANLQSYNGGGDCYFTDGEMTIVFQFKLPIRQQFKPIIASGNGSEESCVSTNSDRLFAIQFRH
jgi:hypothetical protein